MSLLTAEPAAAGRPPPSRVPPSRPLPRRRRSRRRCRRRRRGRRPCRPPPRSAGRRCGSSRRCRCRARTGVLHRARRVPEPLLDRLVAADAQHETFVADRGGPGRRPRHVGCHPGAPRHRRRRGRRRRGPAPPRPGGSRPDRARRPGGRAARRALGRVHACWSTTARPSRCCAAPGRPPPDVRPGCPRVRRAAGRLGHLSQPTRLLASSAAVQPRCRPGTTTIRRRLWSCWEPESPPILRGGVGRAYQEGAVTPRHCAATCKWSQVPRQCGGAALEVTKEDPMSRYTLTCPECHAEVSLSARRLLVRVDAGHRHVRRGPVHLPVLPRHRRRRARRRPASPLLVVGRRDPPEPVGARRRAPRAARPTARR